MLSCPPTTPQTSVCHPDTLQSGHQLCNPQYESSVLPLPQLLFTHPHPVPDGYESVPPAQNSQRSQPPAGGGQEVDAQERARTGDILNSSNPAFHSSNPPSTPLTQQTHSLSLLPDHVASTANAFGPWSSVSLSQSLHCRLTQNRRPGRVSVHYYFSHLCLLRDKGGSWHRSPERGSQWSR